MVGRQVLSWRKKRCLPWIYPHVLSPCTSPGLPRHLQSHVVSAESSHAGNKSSLLITIAAGRPGLTPIHPGRSHAITGVLEAGLNQVLGYSPAGNKTTIRGHFLMAPAQRRVLSEQRRGRPPEAAIRCTHVFPVPVGSQLELSLQWRARPAQAAPLEPTG